MCFFHDVRLKFKAEVRDRMYYIKEGPTGGKGTDGEEKEREGETEVSQ